MKILLWKVLRDWERAILWASVAGLSLVVVFLLSQLAADKAPNQATVLPARSPPSYLNEDTAFDFLQPLPAPDASARNPFAFSCQMPEPKTVSPPGETVTGTLPGGEGTQMTGEGDPDTTTANNGRPDKIAEEVAPPPPKRTANILYRGLYRSGPDDTRQLAFVSTREAPSEVTATAVVTPGQMAAGVTVKRFTPAELVVAGPTGVEVTIAVGTQALIALE